MEPFLEVISKWNKWKTAPLGVVRGEECWEIKSLASTQTLSWEWCYHGNHDIPPAPSLERGGTTDEETEVQRGSLSRSTRESESQARTPSLAPSSPPCLWGPAPSPSPFPHTHRESGQYSGWGRRRPWARKCMRSKGSMWGYTVGHPVSAVPIRGHQTTTVGGDR